jgi:hypothetical protein
MSIPYFRKESGKGRSNMVFDDQVVFHFREIPSNRIISSDVQIYLPDNGDDGINIINQVRYVWIITVSSASKDSPSGTRCTLQFISTEGWGTIHWNV